MAQIPTDKLSKLICSHDRDVILRGGRYDDRHDAIMMFYRSGLGTRVDTLPLAGFDTGAKMCGLGGWFL